MKTVWILCFLAVQNLCHGQNCTDLQILSLWGQQALKDLSEDSIEKIGTLYLEVTNNQDLNGIERLKCLRKLGIKGSSDDSFSSLPAALSQLPNLEDLEIVDVKGLNWTEVFKLIENLPQLKRLVIRSSELTEIPKTVNLPSSLEIVELPLNNLTIFPEALLKLKKLRILNLGANHLKILPTEIGKLVNLEELTLRMNDLYKIPSEIGNLKVLRRLDLYGSELAELPQSIENISQLTYLNLDYNRLKNIPSGVENLSQLTYLNLSRNRISKIPSGISALKNLESLLLEGNLLTSLPVELCSLSKLRKMNVSNNRLTDLPGGLKQLEALDVRGNNFKTEPELFLFYKSKIDSASQKYDSIVLVYNELIAQAESYNRAYDKFVEQSLGNKDSLTKAFQILAVKIYQYNGLDSIEIEEIENLFRNTDYFITDRSARDVRLVELPPLQLPFFPDFILWFKQDFDKSHFSYSIALPSLYKK